MGEQSWKWQKNAVAARDSRDGRMRPPGDGGMVHKLRKNSGDGEARLGWMVGTVAMKTWPAAGRSPEDHHSGPRPRLRGRGQGSPLWRLMY